MDEKIVRSSFKAVTIMKEPWAIHATWLLHSATILLEISKAAEQEIKKGNMTKAIHLNGSKENLLVNDLNSINHSIFLMGLAIENLVKGLWIKKSRKLSNLQAKDKLHKDIITHDLNKLVDFLDIDFSNQELLLLNYFTQYIEWRGRYPIPLNVTTYIDSNNYDLRKMLLNTNKDQLPEDINSIWIKLLLSYKK